MKLFNFFSRKTRESKSAAKSKTEIMIENDGYLWQYKLWRRWIMGQMLHMMTWGGIKFGLL